MDDNHLMQEADDQQQSTARIRSPNHLSLPANPDSWFRRRLDHVRSEARKDIQLKSIRPTHEK